MVASAPVVTPPSATVDEELRAAALRSFSPLVFSFSVETPNTVCLPNIMEFLSRDPFFGSNFHVIDHSRFPTPAEQSRGRHVDRKVKVAEPARNAASVVYENYVRIAVEREARRREAEAARAATIAGLAELYMEEDGLSAAEAAAAAQRDVEEAEAENAPSEDEADGRQRLFVCLQGYPASADDVAELRRTGLVLHAVVSVTSSAPLSGSPVAEAEAGAHEMTRSRRERDRVAAEDKNRISLATDLRHQAASALGLVPPHVRDIVVHAYETPVDALPPPPVVPVKGKSKRKASAAAAAAAAIAFRLRGTETSVFATLAESIAGLEERYTAYRLWSAARRGVDVPRYVPPSYPQTQLNSVKLSTTLDDKPRKKSVVHKKGSTPQSLSPSRMEPIPAAPADPTQMSEVTVYREVYDAFMEPVSANGGRFDASVFRRACTAQVAVTLTKSGSGSFNADPRSEKSDAQRLQDDKEEVGAFVCYIFDVASFGAAGAYANRLSRNGNSVPLLGYPSLDSRGSLSFANTYSEVDTTFRLYGSNPIAASLPPFASCLGAATGLSSGGGGSLPCVTGVQDAEQEGTESTGTNDTDIREVAARLLSESFDVDATEARQRVMELMKLGVIRAEPQADVDQLSLVPDVGGWRSAHAVIGSGCVVSVLWRGDGSTRTESSTYAFRGATGFAEFVEWQQYCEAEELYYNPPPPDSDAEEPEDEESEEEEEEGEWEDEEDEGEEIDKSEGGGNGEKRAAKRRSKRAPPPPPPPVDTVGLSAESLRRRRAYSLTARTVTQSCAVEEPLASGPGTRLAADERQWLFGSDSCTVEVRRTVANTRHVRCTAVIPGGLSFGFSVLDEATPNNVPAVVGSGVRAFLTADGAAQFFFEIFAGNGAAVARDAYARAQDDARAMAKAQYDANCAAARATKASRDKAPPPSLSTLEETMLSQVQPIVECDAPPPRAQCSVLLASGATAQLDVEKDCVRLVAPSLAARVDMQVGVWSNGAVRSVRVHYAHAITVYTDGRMVLDAPDLDGCRIALDAQGHYVTVAPDGTRMRVSATGERTLVTPLPKNGNGEKEHKENGSEGRSSVKVLEPLPRAVSVDATTGVQRAQRSDGTHAVLPGTAFSFGTGISVEHTESKSAETVVDSVGGITWTVAGFPPVTVFPSARRVRIPLAGGTSVVMDTLQETLCLSHCSGGSALLDWPRHRLHVRPIAGASVYVLDCAFGGLVGGDCCVSPFGRCGRTRAEVFWAPEVPSAAFRRCYEESGGSFAAEALQCDTSASPAPLAADAAEEPLRGTATAAAYARESTRRLADLCASPAPLPDTLRIALTGREDTRVHFASAWLTAALLRRLRAVADAAYAMPREGAVLSSGAVSERIVFLRAPHSNAAPPAIPAPPCPLACSVAHVLLMPRGLKASTASSGNCEEAGSAVHFVDANGAVTATDAAALLRATRLVAAEETAWIAARAAAPCAQRSAAVEPLEPLRAVAVAATRCAHGAAARAGRRAKFGAGYWAFSGAVAAAERDGARQEEQSLLSSGPAAPAAATDPPPPAEADDPSPAEEAAGVAPGGNGEAAPAVGVGPVPLMRTVIAREAPPQERHDLPALAVVPSALHFGRVAQGQRYALSLELTNTSTVPCRYRLTVHPACKAFVSVDYPRHFLAAGLTVEAHVVLSGTQPLGPWSTAITITHEGGAVAVEIGADSIIAEANGVRTSAYSLGPSLTNAFVPGSTHRLPPRAWLIEQSKASEGD